MHAISTGGSRSDQNVELAYISLSLSLFLSLSPPSISPPSISLLSPPSLRSWVRGISAGGRERPDINPQFLVELTRPPHFGPYDEVPLLISVMQMKRRLMRTMTGKDFFLRSLLYSTEFLLLLLALNFILLISSYFVQDLMGTICRLPSSSTNRRLL